MTRHELRDTIIRLNVSAVVFGKIVGVDDRTVRRWTLGECPIPAWLPRFTGLLVQSNRTGPDLRAWVEEHTL